MINTRLGFDTDLIRPRLGASEIERRITGALATIDRHNARAARGGFASERLYKQSIGQEVRRIKRLELQRDWEREHPE